MIARRFSTLSVSVDPLRLQQTVMENQRLELHILRCKERLQQRLLQQQIAQQQLKVRTLVGNRKYQEMLSEPSSDKDLERLFRFLS